MTRQLTAIALAALVLTPVAAFAQASANPFTDAVKAQLAQIKAPVTRTAEKVPEDLYAFKPTPEVRSLGQLIGHIADGNHGLCSAASGMKPSVTGIEKSTTTKAALQKALADSFAFCEQAIASMDDKQGAELTKSNLGMQPRLMVFAFNNSHLNEHYGNLVTYMRLKGIVPPSSEPK
ncbi:MAG: DinB family protein [Acidobacteria bacterium]|nr:DinB family protein [Acidobacteriota bacterium]